MIFLDFLKVKKFMKICSKKNQIAPVKKFFRGSMPPNPPSKATRSKPPTPPPKKKNSWPPLGKSCIRP